MFFHIPTNHFTKIFWEVEQMLLKQQFISLLQGDQMGLGSNYQYNHTSYYLLSHSLSALQGEEPSLELFCLWYHLAFWSLTWRVLSIDWNFIYWNKWVHLKQLRNRKRHLRLSIESSPPNRNTQLCCSNARRKQKILKSMMVWLSLGLYSSPRSPEYWKKPREDRTRLVLIYFAYLSIWQIFTP
jgi:hypothetical protein